MPAKELNLMKLDQPTIIITAIVIIIATTAIAATTIVTKKNPLILLMWLLKVYDALITMQSASLYAVFHHSTEKVVIKNSCCYGEMLFYLKQN